MRNIYLALLILCVGCASQRAETAHKRGYAHAQKKEWKQASVAFAEAVKLDPDEAKYHYNLAVALSQRGLYEQAALEAQETLRLDPAYEKASVLMAQLTHSINVTRY
jgi:tetratricopeptide (TPR) repeat protein